jgi:hypothetical protein
MRIFEDEADYLAFEMVLAEAVERTQIRLLAYCLRDRKRGSETVSGTNGT